MSLKSLSTNTKLLIAGGTALIGCGITLLLWNRGSSSGKVKTRKTKRSKKSKKSSPSKKSTSKKAKGELNREALIEIFKKISSEMKVHMQKLVGLEQQFRAQAQQQGQPVNEPQLQQYLMKELLSHMQKVETQVYQEYGTTEKKVKELADLHGEDEEFQKVVKDLKQMWSVLSRSPKDLPSVPDRLTEEVVINCMKDLMESITQAMESTVKDLESESGLSHDDFVTSLKTDMALKKKLNEQYMAKMTKCRQEVHKKYGIEDPQVLHAAIVKFQSSPSFAQTVNGFAAEQQRRFEELGIMG